MNIPILYQDDAIVVVNKPAGVPTHPDEAGEVGGFDVVSLLKTQLDVSYLGVHHRLDREVSGALVFAIQPSANAGLARIFEGRQAEKEYVAIVQGLLPRRAGLIEQPLLAAGNGRWRIARPGEAGSQAARTRYRVETVGPGQEYSLVRLHLETGRTHQLRLHLAHLGCPIIGDPLYGKPSVAHFPRILLHAVRLAFLHPLTGQPLSVQTTLPRLFNQAAEGKPLPEIALAARLLDGSLTSLKPNNQAGLAGLISLAAERRLPLADSTTTTAYRLINGAGDGLPGITLDRFGPVLVLNCYDSSLTAEHPALKTLTTEIDRQWPGWTLYAKFRPRQLSNLASQKVAEPVAPLLPLAGKVQPEVSIVENSLIYLIRPGEGLSPGLFLDMREVRSRLSGWVVGKTVLNCFSYTGAFGLVATRYGASRALNLDAGRKGLEWSILNYRANELIPDDFDFVEGDVFDWLGRFERRGQTFDLVILDPPSYSTVKKTRWSAEKNYDELARLAAKVVAPQGMLLACTNHAGILRRNFRQMVLNGLAEAGRSYEVVGYYHEPGLDFPRPVDSEGYLKVLAVRLDQVKEPKTGSI